MKKLAVILGALLASALLAYTAAGPFITLYQIRSALETQDTEKLAQYVDFPVLRENLKAQINNLILSKVPDGLADNPFGALGLAFAGTLVDSLVEGYVTPGGLSTLLAGRLPDVLPQQPDASLTETQPATAPVAAPQFTYDSPSQFTMRLNISADSAIRLVLKRTGFTWRLTNIILPFTP